MMVMSFCDFPRHPTHAHTRTRSGAVINQQSTRWALVLRVVNQTGNISRLHTQEHKVNMPVFPVKNLNSVDFINKTLQKSFQSLWWWWWSWSYTLKHTAVHIDLSSFCRLKRAHLDSGCMLGVPSHPQNYSWYTWRHSNRAQGVSMSNYKWYFSFSSIF